MFVLDLDVVQAIELETVASNRNQEEKLAAAPSEGTALLMCDDGGTLLTKKTIHRDAAETECIPQSWRPQGVDSDSSSRNADSACE